MRNNFSKNASEHLFQFVRDSHEIGDIEELNRKFGEVTNRFGYDSFICTELIGSHKHTKPCKLFGNWNRQWDTRYFNQQYFRYDDCLRFLAKAQNSFTWEEVKSSKASTSTGLRIMEEAKDFKGRAGLLIPLRSFDGRLSLVSMMGEMVDETEDAKTTLEIAAIYFSDIGARLMLKSEAGSLRGRLTHRQIEILKWLSDGKRIHEIADILGLSIKTIDRHLEDARARLDVLTTHQLLVNAIINGDIAF